MKKVFILLFALINVYSFPAPINAFQKAKIQNHSFAVITEDYPSPKEDISYVRTAIFIKNDDCNIQYKATFGKHVLGEGETQVGQFPYIIRLGNNTLEIRCLVPKSDINVEELEK